VLEDRTSLSDRGECRADPSCSDHENLHCPQSYANHSDGTAQAHNARSPQRLRRLPYAAPICLAPDTLRP
jgi:hypothetical protein